MSRPVVLDCRIARRRETGGARYARELAERLPRTPGAPPVRVAMGPPPLPRRNVLTSLANLLLDLVHTHVTLPALAARHRAAAIHCTFNWAPVWAPCPVVVTVHDLSWERAPEAYPGGFRRFAQIFTRLSVRTAARVIAVSKATADDLVELYGADPGRIDVVYTGIDGIDDPAAPPDPSRERMVLHVGEFEPRKRVPALVEGFRAFRATPGGEGWRLVLAGRGGSDADAVAAAARGADAVEMAGFVGDRELHSLYRRAALLVSASRWEGFCLPVAEALHAGCPVLVADTPALREAGGEDALVIPPPCDAAAVSRALGDATRDTDDLARRGARGVSHARRFGWQRCTDDTLAVYARVGTTGDRHR